MTEVEAKQKILLRDGHPGSCAINLNLSLNSPQRKPTDLFDGLLEVNLSQRIAIGQKPLHRFLESFPECMLRVKAKEFFGPADIQAPSRLPVGLGGVPYNLSCKAGLCGYHGGKIENRDFLSCAQIDG
jgi:hypothetical protein